MHEKRIEKELISKAVKGDGRSFGRLVKKYDRRIMELLINILKNEDDASDAYQITFMKVYKNLEKFTGSSSFYTWLYRIAVNTAYSFYTSRKPHSEFNEDIHSAIPDDNPYTDFGDEYSYDEKLEMVEGSIDKLSFRQKSVVYMKAYDGLKFKEIAEVLSLNEGTVKKYFHRAVENIRKNIKTQDRS